MGLDKLDLAIIALYLVGITLFGLRFRKRQRSLRDYFLAGRDIPWWAIALSIVAAETSTLTIISIPGLAYDTNLTFLQVVMGYVVGRVVISFVLLPHYFRGDLYTAYELIERRFGRGLRSLTAGLFLLTRTAAEGVRVYAVSIVVSIALGTGEVASIAIITVLTLIYTFEGGLAAVIWTDVVQTVIYVGGTLVGLWTILHLVPGGWTAIHAAAASAGKLQVFDFTPSFWIPYTFWAGVIGGAFFTTASHGTDQLIVQRLAGGAQPEAIGDGAAFERRGNSVSVCAVPDGGRYAVGLLSRALGEFRKAGPNLSDVHREPHAARNFRTADCRDPGGSDVESERGSEFAVVELRSWISMCASARRPTSEREMRLSRLSTFVWALLLVCVWQCSRCTRWGASSKSGLQIASVAYGALLGVFLLGVSDAASQPARRDGRNALRLQHGIVFVGNARAVDLVGDDWNDSDVRGGIRSELCSCEHAK